MLSAIRNRITPATVIATLALLFAMTGGAYAAKKYLVTSTKQISPSVLKSLKGAAGKPGANGSSGTPGAKGESGAAGAKGDNGAGGGAGPTGPAGPTGAQGPAGLQGKEGAPGKEGKEGPSGSAGGTLPEGTTETGAWFASNTGLSPFAAAGTVSFATPLAKPILPTGPNEEVHHVYYITFKAAEKKEYPNGCAGSVEVPEAESGNLCVFEGFDSNSQSRVDSVSIRLLGERIGANGNVGASTMGAFLELEEEEGKSELHYLTGSYAVTG
jgi:hypothetical protein